jgi:hypothetical protein
MPPQTRIAPPCNALVHSWSSNMQRRTVTFEVDCPKLSPPTQGLRLARNTQSRISPLQSCAQLTPPTAQSQTLPSIRQPSRFRNPLLAATAPP